MDLPDIEKLMEMIRQSLADEVPSGIPDHWEAVLEARQRFVDDPDQGEDMEDVMSRLRSRRYGN